MGNQKDFVLPDTESLKKELDRVKNKRRSRNTVISMIGILAVVAAVTILVATLILPIYQIHGSSMETTFWPGDIVIAVKNTDIERKDIIAFNYNNKVLVKRVIAVPGEVVNVDRYGQVFVNEKPLNESYLSKKSSGQTNIEFPFKVPEGRYFVMGDNRETSLDSRNTAVGCVTEEQIVGKIKFRVWPLDKFGKTE